MSTNLEEYPDRLAETFKDKTIFITGGTGLMGKVLVEKLLRSCTDLKKIILLVRSKKGNQPEDRIREIFSGPDDGLPMGFSLSPVVANIFVEWFKTFAIKSTNKKPKLWLRYVDDTFIIYSGNDE